MHDGADTAVQRALLDMFSNVSDNEPEDDAGERAVPLPTAMSAALLAGEHDDREGESEASRSGDIAPSRIEPELEADDVNRLCPLDKLDDYDYERVAPDDHHDNVGVREDVAEVEQLVEGEDEKLVFGGYLETISWGVRVTEGKIIKEALGLMRRSTPTGEYGTDTTEFP